MLVVDILNAYDHPDAEKLTPHVEEIIDPLAALVAEADRRDRDLAGLTQPLNLCWPVVRP